MLEILFVALLLRVWWVIRARVRRHAQMAPNALDHLAGKFKG